MKFPFWLIPIFVVVVLLPYINKKQNKTWDKLSVKEKKRIIVLIAVGILVLLFTVAFFFLYKYN